MLNNIDVTQGFYWKEIGIFAEDPDTEEEILFMYATAGETSDFIPAFEEGNILERYVDVDAYITDVENITAIIDSSLVYVAEKEFSEFKTEIDVKMQELEEKIHDTIIVSQTEPQQDCIWYKVLRSRKKEDEDEDTIMLLTSELDGTEIYISEIDNKEEKVINVDEELHDNGNIIFEEV